MVPISVGILPPNTLLDRSNTAVSDKVKRKKMVVIDNNRGNKKGRSRIIQGEN